MSKHTPGPWEVHNGTDVYPVDDEKARFYVADCDPDNAPVASSLLEPGEHPNTDATYEQAMANARLIAAAPDMLEALRRFEAYYPAGINPWLDEAASLARAAIAKAEGRS